MHWQQHLVLTGLRSLQHSVSSHIIEDSWLFTVNFAMTNVSASTSSSSFSSRVKLFPNAQIIAWSFAFSAQAVAVVMGNILAIALFAFNKKLRKKKSLYLVMNMAFADLMLGGIFLPSFIFFLVNPENQASYEISFFRNIICAFFSLASSITAALISAERFYAIYWPLKHRTLSTRAYRLVILMVWTLAILFSTVYVLLFWSPMALYSFLCSYVLFLALTICGLNIGIWRKFKRKTPSHQQNRAFQQQRLTKALLYVSVFTLISWIPISLCNLIGSFGYNIHDHILLLTLFMYLSSSFMNPVVYAIRIPEFKQALPNTCCFRRQVLMDRKRNIERLNMAAADHNHAQLTFEQKIVHGGNDTKLWPTVEVLPF